MYRIRYFLLCCTLLLLRLPAGAQADSLSPRPEIELGSITEDDVFPMASMNYGEEGKEFFRKDKNLKDQVYATKHHAGLYNQNPVHDSLEVANWHKYSGYVMARTRKFDAAEKETRTAIELYRRIRRDDGVAVARHDLSWIYLLQHQYDSALYAEKISRGYWQSINDTGHLFTSCVHLMYLYCRQGHYRMAHELCYQGQQLLSGTVIMKEQILYDFYFLSRQLYRALKDKELEKPWIEKLAALQRQARGKGLRLRSVYETLPNE